MSEILKTKIYNITFDKVVKKFFSKHKWEKIIFQFKKSIEELKINPFKNNLDIKTMKWNLCSYRLRIWKYRFIYKIVDDELIIVFVDADSRWDIY